MGNRYIITGVQLGLLVGVDKQKDRQELADEIMDKQHLWDTNEKYYKEIRRALRKLSAVSIGEKKQ